MTDRDDELLPTARRLGDALLRTAQAESPAPRRRTIPRRTVVVALLLVLALAAGVAGAVSLISEGTPARNPRIAPRGLLPPAGRRPVVVRAADPGAHGSWGVALYRSRLGYDCILAGWLRGGLTLGLVQDGRFHAYSPTREGYCGNLHSSQVTASTLTVTEPKVRTLLYGQARTGVRLLDVTIAGLHRRIRPGPKGAFLLVLDGRVRATGMRVIPID